MAGITIPATGAGTQAPVVATESNAAGHFQYFKLVDGNVGSLTTISSSNPFPTQILGTQNIVGSVTMTGGTWVGSVIAQGDVAHDAADAGNPVKIGGFAVASSYPTNVGSGDRVNAAFDRVGRQLIQPMAPATMRQSRWNAYTGIASGVCVWSAGVNNRIVVTDLTLMAGSATSGIVAVYFARSGAPVNYTVGSGTALFYGEVAPSATTKPGMVKSFTYPEAGDANDAVRISITTAAQVYLIVGGYEIP